MNLIVVEKLNDVHLRVFADSGIEMELSEFFTFTVPGAKFMPTFRNGVWDGKIRIYNIKNKKLYVGLLDQVKVFAQQRNYKLQIAKELETQKEFSLHEAENFIKSLKLSLEPRDYQTEAFVHAVRHSRCLLLSPTASGKSLIIYLLVRYYHELHSTRSLIIVPTINLVNQLAVDFVSYGIDKNKALHCIHAGVDHSSNKPITISTWQSLFREDKKYFQQFDLIVGDEVHTFKADSLTGIMNKLEKCPYRFGFTGTLDGCMTNERIIQGLFGPVKKVTTTKTLIDQKHLSEFKIKALLLKYHDNERKLIKDYNYVDEIDYIVTHPKRNNFIKNLALSLTGNTLLLFQYVEKHGKVLYDMLKDAENREVYFVHGQVDGDEREKIRKIVEKKSNAIIVASVGVFSTGINIPSLKNIIFASPSKSRIRTLQSIGRVLRKSKKKTHSILFDIADDLSWKKKNNYTLLHFTERLKIYNVEQFNYKIYNVGLK